MRVKFTALQCARVLHPSPEQLPSAKVKGQTARRAAPVHRSLIKRAAAFSGELRQYRTNELVRYCLKSVHPHRLGRTLRKRDLITSKRRWQISCQRRFFYTKGRRPFHSRLPCFCISPYSKLTTSSVPSTFSSPLSAVSKSAVSSVSIGSPM